MPVEALAALDATLDAAAAIADGPLAEPGASRARGQALRRAGVVLCASAWETYVGDSLSWVAARAGASAAKPELLDTPQTAHLAALSVQAETAIDASFDEAWKGVDEDDEHRSAEKKWLDGLNWSWKMEVFLRRRIVGGTLWTGPGREQDEPKGLTQSNRRPVAFRIETLKHHTRMPLPTPRNIAEWQKAIYGVAIIEQVRLPRRSPEAVAKKLELLVNVRNASVHRGRTPGPLDTGGVRDWIKFVGAVAHEHDRLILEWADQYLPLRSE